MKKMYAIALFCLIVVSAGAQSIYTDDFETYTSGQGIALQETGDVWTTWSNTPGSAEDPLVSNTYAFEGVNSVKVSGSNDGVIKLNDLTSGRYRVEFYMYVPAGKVGYYNVLQDFNGSNSKWGIQIYFQNGVGTIDGNGEAAASFNFNHGEWFKIQHFIDIDNDWIDFYINDELIHAYQWSHGCFNQPGGVNKLDAINYYAWSEGGGTPEYYMDNFIIEAVETPMPPLNLTAEAVDGDVNLAWEAPSGKADLESYVIIRDGATIATVANDVLSYTDENLYPGDYDYQVKAYYGVTMGVSAPAGPASVNIPGGNQRQFVLYEIFTGTWCQFCPTAAQAIDMMANEGLDVAVLEYHAFNGDIFETPASASRMSYYLPYFDDGDGAFGFPTSIINGTYGIEGALNTVALMNQFYDSYYAEYMAIPTVYTIEPAVDIVSTSPYEYNISIDVTETFEYFTDPMKMYVVLSESDIAYSWQGLNVLNFVVRAMFPTVDGISLDFSTENTQNQVVNVVVDDSYPIENCEVIIFLQNTTTAAIMETYRIKLSDYVGVQDELAAKVSVYPNPASEMIKVRAGENIKSVNICNLAGQSICSLQPGSSSVDIPVNGWASGMYVVQVETNQAVSNYKISIE